MTTNETIVTVWLDETSDADEAMWIVDTDIEGGGESETVRMFDSRADAVAFARAYGAEHGLEVEIQR